MSAVSEAAACEELRVSLTPMDMLCILMSLQKELDLALDEKRSLERICCLWRFAGCWYKIYKLICEIALFLQVQVR